MNTGSEPVIVVAPVGSPADRRAALADVLVLPADGRPVCVHCAQRFAAHPGLTLVAICPVGGPIQIGVRDGALLVLRDRRRGPRSGEPASTPAGICHPWGTRPAAAILLAYSLWASGTDPGSAAARLLARSTGFRLRAGRWRT